MSLSAAEVARAVEGAEAAVEAAERDQLEARLVEARAAGEEDAGGLDGHHGHQHRHHSGHHGGHHGKRVH